MANKKRLRRNKQQGMYRRKLTNKKPMSTEQKKERKKLREAQKTQTDAKNSKY